MSNLSSAQKTAQALKVIYTALGRRTYEFAQDKLCGEVSEDDELMLLEKMVLIKALSLNTATETYPAIWWIRVDEFTQPEGERELIISIGLTEITVTVPISDETIEDFLDTIKLAIDNEGVFDSTKIVHDDTIVGILADNHATVSAHAKWVGDPPEGIDFDYLKTITCPTYPGILTSECGENQALDEVFDYLARWAASCCDDTIGLIRESCIPLDPTLGAKEPVEPPAEPLRIHDNDHDLTHE